jgi:putative transposase
VTRPQARASGRSAELRLPSYDPFSSTETLGQLAMNKMVAGLESTGQAVKSAASATPKSAVSRRFVTDTESALARARCATDRTTWT